MTKNAFIPNTTGYVGIDLYVFEGDNPTPASEKVPGRSGWFYYVEKIPLIGWFVDASDFGNPIFAEHEWQYPDVRPLLSPSGDVLVVGGQGRYFGSVGDLAKTLVRTVPRAVQPEGAA